MKRSAKDAALPSKAVLADPLGCLDKNQACVLFKRQSSSEPFFIVAPGGVPMFRGPFQCPNNTAEEKSRILRALRVPHAEYIDSRRDNRRRYWQAFEPLVTPAFDVKIAGKPYKEEFAGGRTVPLASPQLVGLTTALDAWERNINAFETWMLNDGLRGLIALYLMSAKRPSLERSIVCRTWAEGVEGWIVEYDRPDFQIFDETDGVTVLLFDNKDDPPPEAFCAWFEAFCALAVVDIIGLIDEMTKVYARFVPKHKRNSLVRRAELLRVRVLECARV